MNKLTREFGDHAIFGSLVDVEEVVSIPDNVFACNRCGDVFKHLSSLNYHNTHKVCLKTRRDNKILQCTICDKIFAGFTSYNYHTSRRVCEQEKERRVTDPNSIKCPTCGKSFSTYTALQYHMVHKVCETREPTQEKGECLPKVLQCPNCSKIFSQKHCLDYHIRRKVCLNQRDIKGPPYICQRCGTSYELKGTWYAHVKRQVCKRFPQRYMQSSQSEVRTKKQESEKDESE